MDDNIWIGKKVYVIIFNSNRKYSGKVISETSDKIVIIDIKGHQVEIPKSNSLIQEEA
jgi:RNase P/RNase MRP subunit p29